MKYLNLYSPQINAVNSVSSAMSYTTYVNAVLYPPLLELCKYKIVVIIILSFL